MRLPEAIYKGLKEGLGDVANAIREKVFSLPAGSPSDTPPPVNDKWGFGNGDIFQNGTWYMIVEAELDHGVLVDVGGMLLEGDMVRDENGHRPVIKRETLLLVLLHDGITDAENHTVHEIWGEYNNSGIPYRQNHDGIKRKSYIRADQFNVLRKWPRQ